MTANTIAFPTRSPYRGVRRLVGAGSDILAVAGRNLLAYRRVPQLLVFSTIQPVVFVLMFRYVFGGAIKVPGNSYVDYLMPGIFVQTVVFGSIGTAVGLATDLNKGLLERFRSLPMSRSAVLAGRTTADLARNVFVVALMAAVGFAVGFRVHTSPLEFLAALGLVLLFGYVFSWIFATVGLLVGDPEAAQAAAFPVMAPLVFASSAFVPVSSMPGWLQVFAAHQPGLRHGFGGPGAGAWGTGYVRSPAGTGVDGGYPAGLCAPCHLALPAHGVARDALPLPALALHQLEQARARPAGGCATPPPRRAGICPTPGSRTRSPSRSRGPPAGRARVRRSRRSGRAGCSSTLFLPTDWSILARLGRRLELHGEPWAVDVS